MGLDPGTPGSRPEPKADAQPLSPPGVPSYLTLNKMSNSAPHEAHHDQAGQPGPPLLSQVVSLVPPLHLRFTRPSGPHTHSSHRRAPQADPPPFRSALPSRSSSCPPSGVRSNVAPTLRPRRAPLPKRNSFLLLFPRPVALAELPASRNHASIGWFARFVGFPLECKSYEVEAPHHAGR